ncbi:MAG TPA: hypothetical protein VK623_10765 [Flavobacterium sp.]|nr:hypothetical protein [Flavobacterium sp.]
MKLDTVFKVLWVRLLLVAGILSNLFSMYISYENHSLQGLLISAFTLVLFAVFIGMSLVIEMKIDHLGYLDALPMDKQYQLARQWIDENTASFKLMYPEITGIFAGRKNIKGKRLKTVAVVLQVSKKGAAGKDFPHYVEIANYRIPTDVQQAGFATPLSLSPASGISRKDDTMFGTLGIPLTKDGEIFYMSCYHVYCNEELANGQISVSNANDDLISPCFKELNGSASQLAGRLLEGCLTDFLDIAIMKPETNISPVYVDLPGPVFYRTLTKSDENNIFLRFKGNGSKSVCEGKLRNIFVGQFINYEGKKQHYLNGLIQIDRCAMAGDSGAAVCDINGYYVGSVIASDDNFTYIMSAYTIEDKTNYKFLKT